MKVVSIGDKVVVDICQDGCGGIWFDAFELEKLDQPDESAGWLLDNVRVDLEKMVDVEKPVACPRCDGITLMRQQYPNNENIMIDKCPACGGTWLDFGELFGIRSSNPTSEETRSKTASLFREIGGGTTPG